jgi:hypothetical protein
MTAWSEGMMQIVVFSIILYPTEYIFSSLNVVQETVRELLERGANIGVKNKWEETPISKILPETMESFLDEYCLTSKVHSSDP